MQRGYTCNNYLTNAANAEIRKFNCILERSTARSLVSDLFDWLPFTSFSQISPREPGELSKRLFLVIELGQSCKEEWNNGPEVLSRGF